MPTELLSLSAALAWFAEPTTLILISTGFVVAILSVIVGGGFFFSIPLFQILFPGVSYGAIVGNLKVGSFFRGIGSTWETRKEIDYRQNLIWSVPMIIGTVAGVMMITSIDQRWIFPALIVAIIVAEFAGKLAGKIPPRYFLVASLLLGLYAGFLGAGIGIMLCALLRLKHPADEKIAHVKIQARFLEWFIGIIAVVVHFLHGNLFFELWFAWSIGSVVGGVVGAQLLRKLGTMPGSFQKLVLRIAYVISLVTARNPFMR